MAGFSLLELLVVIMIMTTMALSATALVGNQDQQARYEDSQRHLQQLRTQILSTNPDTLTGYIADTGTLPDTIAQLTSPVADFGKIIPVFDATPLAMTTCPDTNAGLDNTGTMLSATPLHKGSRGSYLLLKAGETHWRDGWYRTEANNTLDAQYHGWQWSNPSIGTLKVASLGSDGAIGGTEPYTQDIGIDISSQDWQIPLDGWNVSVKLNITPAVSDRFGVSLLVYERLNDTGRWRRLSTALSAGGHLINDTFTLTFNAENFACRGFLPYGEHLLVVFKDTNGGSTAPHTGDDEEVVSSRYLRVLPRSLLPVLTLEVN